MGKKEREDAIDNLREQEPTEEHENKARSLAEQQTAGTGGSGSVVTKYQLCGKYCSGCPHGPYAWLVDDDGWHYLGKVGSSDSTDRNTHSASQEVSSMDNHDHEIEVEKMHDEGWISKNDIPVELPEDDWVQHVDALDENATAGLRTDYLTDTGAQFSADDVGGDYLRVADSDGERRIFGVSYDGGDTVGLDEVSREAMESDLASRPLSVFTNDAMKVARRGGSVTVETADGESWTREPEGERGGSILFGDERALTVEDDTVYVAEYEQAGLFPEIGELEEEVVSLDASEE